MCFADSNSLNDEGVVPHGPSTRSIYSSSVPISVPSSWREFRQRNASIDEDEEEDDKVSASSFLSDRARLQVGTALWSHVRVVAVGDPFPPHGTPIGDPPPLHGGPRAAFTLSERILVLLRVEA